MPSIIYLPLLRFLGCPKNWVEHDKYCYKLASDQPDKLNDARVTCQEMLGDLPIIKSKQQNTFIVRLMQSMKKEWFRLGMKRLNGQLLWFDNISAETSNTARYNAWGENEPNGENCAYVRLKEDWNDDKCDYSGSAPSVLCQKARL